MNKPLLILIIIMTTFMCSSCVYKSVNNYPEKEMNTNDSISIEYDGGNVGDEFGSINAWVINNSNYCFVFPYDYGLTLAININNNWEEIPSVPTYYSSQSDIIMEGKGKSIINSYPISLDPDLSKITISTKTKLNAKIIGYVCGYPEIAIEKDIPFFVEP